MEEFKNQLAIYIPLTSSIIFKLENQLSTTEEEIKVCKQLIESKKKVLRLDKVKEFILSKEHCLNGTKLSCSINRINQIKIAFLTFENQTLDYKRSKFISIEQLINDKINYLNFSNLLELLDKTKASFKLFHEDSKANLIKKHSVDQTLPTIANQLIERRQCNSDLNEKSLNLVKQLNDKQEKFNSINNQLAIKQSVYDEHLHQNLTLKRNLKNQTSKLNSIKFQIRTSIFGYLNKIKRLECLTETKNRKIDAFRDLFKKYSKEGIAKLNEKKLNLTTSLGELNRLNEKPSVKENRKVKDGLKSKENAKFMRQLKKQQNTLNLIDKLNCLDDLYDKLIEKYENKTNSLDDLDCNLKSRSRK